MFYQKNTNKGFLLLNILVGVFLFSLCFIAFFGLLRLASELVINTKSRIGALALANETLEYVRSLSYGNVGAVGGAPSGVIPQSEAILLNGISYTREILIDYMDNPADGIGALDQNGIVEDYKKVEVKVLWKVRGVQKFFSLNTDITPLGIEQPCISCGSIEVTVKDALQNVIQGASVNITNYTVTPIYSETRITGFDGMITKRGLPVGSGYHVVVTKSGYSTDQTYDVNVSNPIPNPGNLTVNDQESTAITFQIDLLAEKTIHSFMSSVDGTWVDTFANSSLLSKMASTSVSSDEIRLAGSPPNYEPYGEAYSVWIVPSSAENWGVFSWSKQAANPADILFRVYYDNGGTEAPISNADLPGNIAGFSTSPVNLSSLSVGTYPKIKLVAFLSTTNLSVTPKVKDWQVTYATRVVLPNFLFTIRSAKTIGTGVYKYSQSFQTNGSGVVVISPIEWGAYSIIPSGGYDIFESCSPQMRYVYPDEKAEVNLELIAHTEHSLLVLVQINNSNSPNPTPIPGATVRLYRSGFNQTKTASLCGQAFWGGLPNQTYKLEVSAPGYETTTVADFDVTGTVQKSVSLVSI